VGRSLLLGLWWKWVLFKCREKKSSKFAKFCFYFISLSLVRKLFRVLFGAKSSWTCRSFEIGLKMWRIQIEWSTSKYFASFGLVLQLEFYIFFVSRGPQIHAKVSQMNTFMFIIQYCFKIMILLTNFNTPWTPRMPLGPRGRIFSQSGYKLKLKLVPSCTRTSL